MACSFVAYIDESGDDGFKFDRGSSEWFILSALVARKEDDIQLVKLLATVRATIGRHKEPLHFRKLRHHHRVPYVGELARAPATAITVLFRKPALTGSPKLQEPNCLYFYGVRFLFERLSWLCRDSFDPSKPGDGRSEVVFSNRSTLKYSDLREYMDKLRSGRTVSDVNIAWDFLDPDIRSFSHGKRAGLQLADAVTSSFFHAVELNKGYAEDRYVKMLKPIVYCRRGNYRSYGAKVFPADPSAIETEERFRWLREDFKTERT